MSEGRLITATSPSSASTFVGTDKETAIELNQFDSITIVATLQGATGGNLDVYLQACVDDTGTNWVDYAHFPQLAGGAAASTTVWSVSRAAQQLTLTTVGTGTASTATPVLAANSIVGGEFGDRLRLVLVAGAGTSAGAPVVIRIFGTLAAR